MEAAVEVTPSVPLMGPSSVLSPSLIAILNVSELVELVSPANIQLHAEDFMEGVLPSAFPRTARVGMKEKDNLTISFSDFNRSVVR